MTSDNNNIEVSSFSYGGDNDGNNSCGSTGQIAIPALHSNNNDNIGNSIISNSLGGRSSIPKKRKSLWKRLLKRGGSKYSEGMTTTTTTDNSNRTRGAVPPSIQPNNPVLFEASFNNPTAAGVSISTATVDNNDSPNNAGGPRASSSGLPTTTADLLRHRAARRSRSIGRSRSISGNGGNALSALEASRNRAHSSNCGRSYAANDNGIGQDLKAIMGNDEANVASFTAGHDLRLAVGAPPSPPGSGKQQHQQQQHYQLSSSPATTSSSNHRHHNHTHQQQQQQRKMVDPFFRHPPLSPPHHGISSIRSGIAPSSCGKSVTSKGTGGSTVCRGEHMTMITSTTASMTVSTTPTVEGDGSSINPSLRTTPTIRMSIGSGKDNRSNHISTNIPRLRTPSTDPPTARTRRMMDSSSPSASSSASSKSNKDHHRHPVTAVVTPDTTRGRRDPPSSSSPPSSRADSGSAVATVAKMTGMDPDGSKFLHSTTNTTTTTASDWTLHEEDQTATADLLSQNTATPAAGCSTTSASSGQRRRRRQGGNVAASTGALTPNNTDDNERSTGTGTKNYDSGYDGSGGSGAAGNAATAHHGVGDANNSGDGSTKRDLERHISITAVGSGGPSVVTPTQASGKNHHFQVGTTVAAGDEEEIIEEETSSSAISRRKNDSNNINKDGVSSLVVEEVTRYITNPSTNNGNNDQGNNNSAGTSTRGPRVGKVAMSRFTAGKNKASSAPGIMMPKASKLSRKKKATPFSRGAGNSGGHEIGSPQENKPADKNGSSSPPLNPLQGGGGGGGGGPQRESFDGGNTKITTSKDKNANTSAADALDNGKKKTSSRNTPLPPTSIVDNSAANKNNDSHLSSRHANSGSAAVAAASAKNNNAQHPHLYAEINIPVSNKLSKRPSPNDGPAIAGEGGGDDVSLAMTSLSSLTGRSSIFGIPAIEGGAAGVMGVGINNMYASMIPNTWCTPGGGAGSGVGNRNNSGRLSHPYQEENYFDYDENNKGNLGQAEHYAAETENLNSRINDNEEGGIMDRVVGAWNDALKSTCQCFDVATTDDEPLWKGGGDGDAVAGIKSRATENANVKNKDATSADVATKNANLSQQLKASAANSNIGAGPPPTFSKPMDI